MNDTETLTVETKRSYSYVHFKVSANRELSFEEVRDLQIKAGYHPAGYSGPWDIRRETEPDGTITHHWACAASCD